jgi:hypothetical protein
MSGEAPVVLSPAVAVSAPRSPLLADRLSCDFVLTIVALPYAPRRTGGMQSHQSQFFQASEPFSLD